MEKQVFSVGELVSVVNQTLEFAYPTVVVEGEVSSFNISKSKFVFFDLKDNEAAIGCFMMVYALKIPLENGMKIRVLAQPRLTAWGKFSLTILRIMPVGQGSIKRAFDLLRARLETEGLFDPVRKRILPQIPQRIALVGSVGTAGYADFLKIVGGRWGGLAIEVANVHVQGLSAGEQIIRAIDFFNQQAELADVLVIIRGGGSLEDLAVFNEESLVRAVASSRIPTVVGVGHETDVSLCDLAADVRAATPSNAAQLVVPDRTSLLNEVAHREKRLLQHVETAVAEQNSKVNNTTAHMLLHVQRQFESLWRTTKQAQRLLRQLDPNMALRRGYALVRAANGTLLRGKVQPGDVLAITTEHAIITAGVKNVVNKES
ncbi:MAG TPA: exodeoxyribonuclease VII large subunit [Candidatus Saccharimonadales bacterium]|nr:exodeoxyribonuclease VII large subunit [Candidatus Saccharimonadales bacterium]